MVKITTAKGLSFTIPDGALAHLLTLATDLRFDIKESRSPVMVYFSPEDGSESGFNFGTQELTNEAAYDFFVENGCKVFLVMSDDEKRKLESAELRPGQRHLVCSSKAQR